MELFNITSNIISGLSRLTSDPRSAIRKSALEVLFNILKDHGHLFSSPFWINVFNSVIFPIFSFVHDGRDAQKKDDLHLQSSESPHPDRNIWDSETSALAVECLVDLFVCFFEMLRSQLPIVVSILAGFIRSSGQGPSSAGVAALMRLTTDLRGRLSEEEWLDIFLALKEAAISSLPGFLKLLRTMDSIDVPEVARSNNDTEKSSGLRITHDDSEDDNLQTAAYVVSRVKSHLSIQLLVIQVLSQSLCMCM